MEYTCSVYSTDGQVKRNQRNLRLIGNSLDKESWGEDVESFTSVENLSSVLKRTFLPVGYPNSVRPEYLTYQFWDSLQGMSSYLRSVLTTRSVLAGAGVGSAESTALAAALTWVFRDGIGMIGSLVFAYYYANAFEIYIKEWRYLADVLNNVGLTLDLVSSYLPGYYFILTSISTLCKACCGLIAGATKARISAHFAMPGHLADVTAKESTQETAVALCGLIVGMLLAKLIGEDDRSIWLTFTVLLCVHQYANYQLVRVLVFHSLNPQRCWLIANHSLQQLREKVDPIDPAVFPSVMQVSQAESFFRPVYLTYFGPEVGGSITEIADTIQFIVCTRSGSHIDQSGYDVVWKFPSDFDFDLDRTPLARSRSIISKNVACFFAALVSAWPSEKFIIGVNMNGRVITSLHADITPADLTKAYLISYYVHIRLSSKLVFYGASFESKQRVLTQLFQYLISNIAPNALIWYDQLCAANKATSDSSVTGKEKSAVPKEPWNLLETASLPVAQWRYHDLTKVKDGDW